MRRRVDLNHVGAAEHAQIWRTTAVVRLGLKVLLVCAGYYAGAIVGITFGFPPAGISTIWPPNAVVLAALLLEPPRVWWVYPLAALPTHLHVAATFQPNVTLPVMLSQFTGNAIHILVAAAAVRAAAGAPPRFDSLRGMGSFVLFAAIAATAIAAVVAVGLFMLLGWVTDFWLAWRQRFFSNGFAVLTITPPIVLAFAGELVGARRRRGRRYVELALVIIGLIAVGTVVFVPEVPSADIMPALLVAPLPFVLYAALRLGPGGVCISLLVVAFVSWTAVYAGRWPFTTPSPAYNVLAVHAFLLTISIPMMFLAAVVEERRRTEEATRRQRDELAHALRVTTLGELVASIAHELNQPLSALMTNAQAGRRLLEADHSSDAIRKTLGEIRDMLGDVVEEANRAAQIIRRLQALFRKERAEQVALDINPLIDDVIGLIGADFQQKRIVIRVVRNEALPLVLGDPVQLQQVVLNLLMNAGEAVAAIDDVRVVSVDFDGSGPGRLMFSVRDTGIGVKDPTELEKIFEHFVSSKPQGLGMGLTISRSIVEAHGGRIWAVANDDRGLTLHVELPTLAARQLPFTHV
jgi:signal transduction histidine kinase